MADAIAIVSKPVFEKLAGDEPALGEQLWIPRYDSLHRGLETLAEKGSTLYLVTVRPGERLWLVQALHSLQKDDTGWKAIGNHGATADLTPMKAHLEIVSNVAAGKLAMSLQTPRALSKHDAMLLRHVANEAFNRRQRKLPYDVTLPEWLLEEAARIGAPEAPMKKKAPTEKPKKSNVATPKAEKAPPRAVLSDALVEGALAQIQEVVDGGDDPSKMLGEPRRKKGLRGRFTETVQSIFAGNEPAELRRLLRDDLAPFVDGPALALALAEVKDDVPGDLVDQFAIRAIDDLARALVALALGRPDDVPVTCRPFGRALEAHVEQVRALLEG